MRRTAKSLTRLGVLSLAAALAAVLALPGDAWAAKGAGGGGGGKKGGGSAGTGTISLVLVDSTDGLAHYGQTVTFAVSTTATSEPWVHLQCYQGRTLVGEGWDGYFEGSLSGRDFVLSSPSWTGGDADCTASLTDPNWTVLARTSFHVYA